MRKTIRATFSAEQKRLNLTLPKGWGELSQTELAMALRSKARNEEPWRQRLAVLLHLTGMKIIRREGDHWVCSVPTDGELLRFALDPELLPSILDNLNWLDVPGGFPVRLDRLRGAAALPAMLHDVAFGTYLQCENCYQGIVQSQSEEAVAHLASLLYPGLKGKLAMWEQLGVIQWWAQVKTLFAGQWPNFFKPGDGGSAAAMVEVMNNQIRALTGGDVTKEAEILAIDTWRALTELDAKAREADEFNRKMKKK